MTRPRILLRADASHGVGFGHVARLCALMEELEASGREPVALFGGDPPSLTSWMRDRKLQVQIGDWSATHVVHVAEELRVAAVIVDGPPIAAALVPRLAERKLRTILIDDRGSCAHAVSAAVNHNFHAPQLAGTYPLAQRRLLGRRYLMLRREIRRYTRGSCRPMSGPRLRVIVSFGGSDPVNATARTLHLLPEDRPLELVVIAGPGYRDEEALRDAMAAARDRGHVVDLRRSPEDPGALFVSADAAISSAGGTLGELAYLGCPAIAYAIVADQMAPARHQVREGLIAGGRTWAETDDDTLRTDFARFLLDDKLRAEQRARALATADSEGARRVVDEALG